MLSPLKGHSQGFSLLELMVVVSLIGLLSALGAPSLSEWIRSTRVRTTAEALQNGLRMAQAEAIRQNRQVVLSFTNQAPGVNAVATANGANWSIQTVPLAGMAGDNARFVRGGVMADVSSGVAIDTAGVTAVCFDPSGALVRNPAPGPANAACSVAAVTLPFNVSFSANASSAKSLQVNLSVSGRIRICDRDKTRSANNPDGC